LGVALLLPGVVHAASVGVDLGGGYWFDNAGQVDLHVRVDQRLGRYVSIGIRPGLLLDLGGQVEVGVPIDAVFRFHIPHVYFDVMGGLAVLLGNAAPLRAHLAAGLGVPFARYWAVGIEAGWLQSGAQLLARFSVTF
jgi:hypothetical protein